MDTPETIYKGSVKATIQGAECHIEVTAPSLEKLLEELERVVKKIKERYPRARQSPTLVG